MSRGEGGGRPPLYTDAALLQVKIDEYFEQCKKDKEPPTITGLAIALDMTTETLREYALKSKFSVIVKKAKTRVEHALVRRGLLSERKPTMEIFLLKANFGYTENIGLQHSSDLDNPPNIQVNFVNSRNKSGK